MPQSVVKAGFPSVIWLVKSGKDPILENKTEDDEDNYEDYLDKMRSRNIVKQNEFSKELASKSKNMRETTLQNWREYESQSLIT